MIRLRLEELFLIDGGTGRRKIPLKDLDKPVILIPGDRREDTKRVIEELEKKGIPYETSKNVQKSNGEYVIDLTQITLEY
ncbi:MAG: hypothetical protein AABX30_03640 [Nanoarchaeota archaeon]